MGRTNSSRTWEVGPLTTSMRVLPTWGGGTTVAIPPLGELVVARVGPRDAGGLEQGAHGGERGEGIVDRLDGGDADEAIEAFDA